MTDRSVPGSNPSGADVEVNLNNDTKVRLRDLTAQATLKYSIKDYNAAAELYSQATELQAEQNGEMSSQNANLLYSYGRCLYHVAVSNSDVLGSKVVGEKNEGKPKRPKATEPEKDANADEPSNDEEEVAEEAVARIVEDKNARADAGEGTGLESRPYFQFTGDENFDDSDEGEDGEGNDEDAEPADEVDDFVNAYEVLDLARILLLRRLEELQSNQGEGKTAGEQESVMQLKERLADTHDLQAEISLEGERFPNAVVDLKAALALKQDIFPQESSLIAEAHYKLSLALEFSSVTQQKNENGEVETGEEAHVDSAMREDAAREMEKAIVSCNLRIQREEAALVTSSTNGTTGKVKVTKESIDDVKEMVKDMEQRLVELRHPPVSINDPQGTGAIDGDNPLHGILGSILGESPATQKIRLEEVSKGANDLTNLVKRKKPVEDGKSEIIRIEEPKSNGKRKVEFAEEVVEVGTGKKAKISAEDDI